MGTNESHRISIVCRADGGTSITVYENEPLILSVSMVNDGAITAASYNYPLKDEIKELENRFKAGYMEEEEFKASVEEIESRIMRERVYRLGSPEGWPQIIKFQALSGDTWREVNWPLKVLIYLPKGQVANLDAVTSCYVEYGLDPEDAKRPKGEFQVKALVELSKDEAVESNVVTVNLLKGKVPKGESETEERLIARGEYAYKRRLYDEALNFVQRALEINPSSIPALNLLGDIEHIRGNLSVALSVYENALEEFNKQQPGRREPPHLIIKKIKRLRALTEG